MNCENTDKLYGEILLELIERNACDGISCAILRHRELALKHLFKNAGRTIKIFCENINSFGLGEENIEELKRCVRYGTDITILTKEDINSEKCSKILKELVALQESYKNLEIYSLGELDVEEVGSFCICDESKLIAYDKIKNVGRACFNCSGDKILGIAYRGFDLAFEAIKEYISYEQ